MMYSQPYWYSFTHSPYAIPHLILYRYTFTFVNGSNITRLVLLPFTVNVNKFEIKIGFIVGADLVNKRYINMF